MYSQHDCTGVFLDGTTHTFKVGQKLVGLRFRAITLRMGFDQLQDPRVLEWMSHVRCRVTHVNTPLNIEVF